MNVTGGATDVTTYFALRLSADGTAATGLTITTLDLQYTRSGVAPVAKVGALALPTTDSAHDDNKAIEIDATDQPGLYRVDWPDAAFAAGVSEVILTVRVSAVFTEHLAVQIDTPVATAAIADAVWDEAASGHVAAGSFGTQCGTDIDAILADTNELQVDDVPGLIAALNDPASSAIADAVWDEVLTSGAHNVASSAGRRLRNLQEFAGYEGGAIWIDTVNGTAGTTNYENGTVQRPVNTIADANTLSASLNIESFQIVSGSSITFAASQADQVFSGDNWTLALGGQTVNGLVVKGASVSGIMAGTGDKQEFVRCHMNATSLIAGTHIIECDLAGTQTIVEAGDITFDRCRTNPGDTITVDYGAAIGNTNVQMSAFYGDLRVQNMGDSGTDTLWLEGAGKLTGNSSTGGTATVSGLFTLASMTNITVNDDARFDVGQLPDGAGRIFSGTATNSSSTTKVFVQATDPVTGGADDDYNGTMIMVWDGTDKTTARLNIRAVLDYDDSDPSFTVDVAFGFTPSTGDLVEIWSADTAALDGLTKLTTGFGTATENTLEGYLRAMMNSTATAPSSAGGYNPLVDSLEILGQGQVDIKGASFATGTDSLAQIRDAIDTLVAPSVVGSSALSGSGFLSDCVSLVRQMTDEPSLSAKYTDSDIVEHVTSAMTIVMSEIHNNSDHNILCRFNVTLVSGQQAYILPPNVGEIWAVRKMSTTTPVSPVYEVWSDNHWSSHQSGFVIEYNEFRLLTDWRSTDTLEILYVPNGESLMHKGTATAATANTITFAASPTDGTLETRANGYGGFLCRLLSDTNGYVQERIIDSYVNTTRVATLTTDWDPTPSGTIVYEVLPSYSNIIKHCVCFQASLDILGNEGNQKRLQLQERRYLVKMRALRQMIGKKSSRFGGHMIGDTSDNDNRGDYFGWLV